jgi:outer membrane protein OmpA-like peptidoglycan-associated protein
MGNQEDKYWISISDMMTGLMVIFMFIAISYILEVQKKEDEIKAILGNFENYKAELRTEFAEMLEKDLAKWREYILFDSLNLSIKFIGKDIQFLSDSDIIPSRFRLMLDDFIPAYLEVVSKEKYRDKIAEIRIEGHANKPELSDYMRGVFWSQQRARSVLTYLINKTEFKQLPIKTRQRLEFWLVANGYGYGRTLDEDFNYSLLTEKTVCTDCSRRVEFRIITSNEQVLEEIIQKIKD